MRLAGSCTVIPALLLKGINSDALEAVYKLIYGRMMEMSIVFMSLAGVAILTVLNGVEAAYVKKYKRTHNKRGEGFQWWKPWQEN